MTASPANRFRSVALLGEGGMARVYLVLSEGLAGVDKLVVLKLLRPELAHDQPHRAMFLDEARLAVKLEHPNIVHTFEAGERGNLYFLMMEFLDGQPLSRMRQHPERLPLRLHLHVLAQVLKGLVYAHELVDLDGAALRIVHRDVSPQNVFITYDGRVKVVDFGIAKATSSREQTEAGIFKGKTAYSSPEQVMTAPLDQRSDVFSFGILLWEAITGQRYWGSAADVAILLQLANEHLPSMPMPTPDAPAELIAICRRALAWDRDERYETSRELANALDDYLATRQDAASARDLSDWLRPRFAGERSQLRRKIELHARSPADASEADFLSAMLADQKPRLPSQATFIATAAPAPGPARGVQRASALAIALAVVGVAVVVGTLARRTPSATTALRPASALASNAVAAASLPAPTASAASTMTLEVRVDPVAATVTIDGVPSEHRRVFPRDGARHRLTIFAPGFEPRTEEIVFDRDLSLSVALRAAQRPLKNPSPQARPSVVPPLTKPAATLDEESPYSR